MELKDKVIGWVVLRYWWKLVMEEPIHQTNPAGEKTAESYFNQKEFQTRRILPQLAAMSRSDWPIFHCNMSTDIATRANVSRNVYTSFQNGFIWRRYCGKKQIDSGLAWSMLLQRYSPSQWFRVFCKVTRLRRFRYRSRLNRLTQTNGPYN